MIVDFWGFGGNFHIDLPTQPVLFVIYILTLLSLMYFYQEQGSLSTGTQKSQFRNLFLILLSSGIVLIQVLRIHFIQIEPDPSINNNYEFSFALLGALPWVLAAGLLGYRQAVVIAFVGGIALAGWGTMSSITPLHLALQAAVVSWMMRNNYEGWLGRLFRNPIFSGLLGGLAFSLLHGIELLASIESDLFEGLNYILSNFKLLIYVNALPLLFAGILGAFLRRRFQSKWFQARWLAPNPLVRSLTGKFITLVFLLGLFSSMILVTGIWFTAKSSATELVETQMKETAEETSSVIPFFIQTGRSLVYRHGVDITPYLDEDDALEAELKEKLTVIPYFTGFAIFTSSEELRKSVGLGEETFNELGGELQSGLQVAFNGVPNEVLTAPTRDERAAQLVFLSPLFSGAENQLVGVLAGWTTLDINPLLLPSIEKLRTYSSGEGFIADSHGKIIIHADPRQIMQITNIDLGIQGEIFTEDTNLRFVHAVVGYPWYVVISSPPAGIRRLAVELALPMISMILLLGGFSLVIVYAVSRRLTNPLEKIAVAAESIAHGNLEKPIPIGGEDEIGRLSKAFERMRSSLQSRIGEMDLLLAVSQRVASSLELEEFLPPILNGVHGMTNASLVRLSIVPENPLDEHSFTGFNAGQDPGGWASLDSQIQELSQSRGHFILENPGRARAVLNLDAITQNINALVAFPIHSEVQFIGTLWLGYETAPAFAANEINLLGMIARHLGVAIANAQLYHQGESERARLNTILQAIPDAVIVADSNGVILMTNPAVEDVLGVDFEQAVGKHAKDVSLPPKVANLLLEPSPGTKTGEVQSSNDRTLFYSMTDREQSSEAASGKIAVFWDVTQFKQLDLLKSEFVSTITQDLNEPLKRMKGYVTMFSKVGTINQQQNEFLSKIMESTERMSKMVGNLIDLGKRDAGSALKIELIDVAELIEEVLHTIKPQAANREIIFELEIQSAMQPLHGDKLLLQQALGNIVDNAIKFSDSGQQIVVRAEQNLATQKISVHDQGMGISHPDQARLFEKFYQVRSSGNNSGSGLGLSIVKSIVEQHGGQVHVKSRLGRGSSFTIELPLHPAAT